MPGTASGQAPRSLQVHRRQAPQDGIVLYDNVSPQGGGVGHDHAVAHLAVMSHMGISHKQVAVADAGDAAAVGRTPVERGKLPDGIAVADDQLGFLTPEF